MDHSHETNNVFKAIDERFLSTLQHVDLRHDRHLILFSGAPGTGKSTLAKTIEKTFGAIRVENDAIRGIILELYPALGIQERTELLYSYTEGYFYYNLAGRTQNGLWVIDASVDRRYHMVEKIAADLGFPTTLLNMDIPENVQRERIMKRGDKSFQEVAGFLELVAQRRAEQRMFLKNHTPDFVIKADTKAHDVIDFLTRRLKH